MLWQDFFQSHCHYGIIFCNTNCPHITSPSQDSNHVIVVHCKGGKGRTGCAIAAYIQFSNICLTATEALDKFAVKRFYDESLGGVTQPSQRRIVHYFSSLIKNEVRLENRQLTLNAIILFGCPDMDGKNGAKICFCVYEGFKPVYTTSVYGLTTDRERVYVNVNNLKVQSDVMVKAFHITKTGKTCIMRVQFHTAFVTSDFNLVFRKKDMDIACRDDRFPNDGVLQLMFKQDVSVVTDDIDSTAHQALITDIKEAKEIEEMSKNVSLMSFEYADYTSFFTDNPISELKQNEMLDKILTLHDDYRLITPLQPFNVANEPPPIPPKIKVKDTISSNQKSRAPDENSIPSLPPRKFKPPPIELPKLQDNEAAVDRDDEYISFETAPNVRDLVGHFEREDEINNFDNWVKFDDDDDEPLIDLIAADSSNNVSADNENKKIALTNTTSAPSNSYSGDMLEGCISRSKSWDKDKENDVTMEKSNKRSSAYIPYVRRKESVKKDKKGNKKYIPYCQRNTSIESSHSSTSSSPSFQSPPPLPPRGNKAAPGPSGDTSTIETQLLGPRASRLPSLSKSMDNLPLLAKGATKAKKVPLNSPESGDPKSIEYSLINWEKVQLRKVIRQTKSIWFRPDISRQESQATLVSQCPGAFIIRVSQTLKECFGLTIRLEDGKKHEDFNLHPGSHKVSNFLIQKNSKGGLYINGYGGVDFTSLEDLVEFFTNHTGGLPHPLKVPTQPYTDRVDEVVPMLLRNVSFPVFILEKRWIRYLPLDSFEEDNVKSLLTETIAAVKIHDIRLISMSVTKHGICLTDPDCLLFDCYTIPYKQIRNCEVGNKDQTIPLPPQFHKQREITATFGLIHRDEHDEIIYIALAEFEDSGISITKTINKFRSYLV